MQRLNHRARWELDPEEADTSKWPDVVRGLIKAAKRDGFDRNKQAMILYLGGHGPEYVYARTRVHQQRLGELLDRCLALHPDGRIWGFRACVPKARVRSYSRTKPLPDAKSGQRGGYAGAFSRLLNEHEELEEFLTSLYHNKAKAVGIGQEVRISVKSIKKRFLDLCRSSGIRPDQYPLNSPDEASESIRRFLKSLHDTHYVSSVVARSVIDANVAAAGLESSELDGEPLLPFEAVEFDGHTIDLEVELEIWMPTPTGVETPVIMGRLTLLLLVDLASSAIIGYHVVLHRNYNTTDALLCFASALDKWEPMDLSIPGLEYLPGAGLPSGVIPECVGACFNRVKWDNHRVHISPKMTQIIKKTIKCSLNPGKHKKPLARSLIELTFRLLEEKIHRLPGTTGSHPRDSRRTKQKDKNVKRLRLHEFLQILDVIIANHNATVHRRDFGQTPNEFIRSSIEQGLIIVRGLSEVEKADCSLMKVRKECAVRGNFHKGRRPYVYFKYAEYSSPRLAQMPSLIGKKLVLDFNRRDIRQPMAYYETGEQFGILTVERLWASTPHTIEQRVLIARMIKRRQLDFTAHPDPIHAAVDNLAMRAAASRNAASRYADLMGNGGRPRGTPILADTIPPPPPDLRDDSTESTGQWKPSRRHWIHLNKR